MQRTIQNTDNNYGESDGLIHIYKGVWILFFYGTNWSLEFAIMIVWLKAEMESDGLQ